jgi:hypothetical protein
VQSKDDEVGGVCGMHCGAEKSLNAELFTCSLFYDAFSVTNTMYHRMIWRLMN